VTRQRVAQWGRQYAAARPALATWLQRTRAASWANLAETRRTFPHADEVRVSSGRTATVFNIAGNNYRLIAAIHYNTGVVYAMRLMTHAEYAHGDWKDTL